VTVNNGLVVLGKGGIYNFEKLSSKYFGATDFAWE
jgi:hypothetical protein